MSKTASSPSRRILWLQDRILRAVIFGLGRVPHRWRMPFAGALVSRVLAPLSGYHARAEANLAYIYPDMTASDRRTLARAVADNAGRTMVENYDVAGLLARMAPVAPEGAGLPAMEQARAEGRPILFVTAHYGNFEAPRAALVARGWQIGGLYRPMSNPFFNDHYARNMHALSGPVFEQGRKGTLGLVKHIRDGGMGVLLFDIYDSDGVPIDFLGKPAPTLTSAADIALRTGALMVPFFGIRQADGLSYRAVFEAPIPPGDPVEMMAEATQRLEARIAEDPAQWFWIHRRWKPKRQARRAARKAGDA